MSLLFMDGYDKYGTFASEYQGEYSLLQFVTTSLQTGRAGSGKALRWQSSGSGSHGNTQTNVRIVPFAAAATTVIAEFGYRPVQMPVPNDVTCLIGRFVNSGGAEIIGLYRSTTGTLQVGRPYGTLLLDTTHILTIATWVHVGLKVILHDTTGEVYLQINGLPLTSLTGVDTQAAAGGALYWEWGNTGSVSGTAIQEADDLVIMNGLGSAFNDFLGDRQIVIPALNGDVSTAWDGTAPQYQLIDEIGPNAADFISTGTDNARALFSKAALDARFAGATGIAVKTSARTKKDDAGARTMGFVAVHGASETVSTKGALPTTAEYRSAIFETRPGGAAPFTQAEFDAANFGVETGAP